MILLHDVLQAITWLSVLCGRRDTTLHIRSLNIALGTTFSSSRKIHRFSFSKHSCRRFWFPLWWAHRLYSIDRGRKLFRRCKLPSCEAIGQSLAFKWVWEDLIFNMERFVNWLVSRSVCVLSFRNHSLKHNWTFCSDSPFSFKTFQRMVSWMKLLVSKGKMERIMGSWDWVQDFLWASRRSIFKEEGFRTAETMDRKNRI